MQYGFAVDFNLKMYQYISHRYQCWSCEDPICESISPARMVPHCNGRTFNDYRLLFFSEPRPWALRAKCNRCSCRTGNGLSFKLKSKAKTRVMVSFHVLLLATRIIIYITELVSV